MRLVASVDEASTLDHGGVIDPPDFRVLRPTSRDA